MSNERPQCIGNYQILDEIGKGGMATVYKAIRTPSNQAVALKALPKRFADDPEWVERFHREARAVAMLDHPNIVRILDEGLSDGQLYFVMEYIEGWSLEAVLKQRRLSIPEATMIFKEVSKGLEFAYRKGIIHRDLNPGNVLVSSDLSEVKLADFGLCRVEAISRQMGTLPTIQAGMGLHYMAPEQAVDPAAADHRSDIYSLGVLFYEMLTGRVPVGRFSLPSQLNSAVPPDLDPIVLKCLETDARNRYPSVAKLLAAVQKVEKAHHFQLVSELSGISRSTTDMLKRSARPLQKRLGIVVLGLALLVGAAAGAWLLRDRWLGSAEVAPNEASVPAEVAASEQESATPTVSTAPAETKTDLSSPAVEAPTAPIDNPEGSTAARELQSAREKLESKSYGPALEELQAFTAKHPQSPQLGEAYFLIATIHDRQKASQEARAAYAEVANRFSRHMRAPEAKFRLAQLTLESSIQDKDSEAARLFAEVAASYPDTPWAPQALAQEAGIETDQKVRQLEPGLGNVPKALLTYRALVDRYPAHPSAEDAYWKLAAMYEDLKRFEPAAQCYWDLAVNFPDTRYDAWWQAAETYDKKVKDKEKAAQAYQRVPSSSRFYDEAQKRASKLTR